VIRERHVATGGDETIGMFRIMPHGRLQEWIAEEKGYSTDAGLDYEFITEEALHILFCVNGVARHQARRLLWQRPQYLWHSALGRELQT
jgi:hypothetical protein